MTNRGPHRTLEDALRNAERIRKEIPVLVQPEDTCYDMVALADEIYRLRGDSPISRAAKRNRECCDVYDAYYDSETREWTENTCIDPSCEFCRERPPLHPEFCECTF